MLYAGGESEAAKDLIARRCDAYVMHGDPPERIRAKVDDMRSRRERLGLPPMQFGVAAYSIIRDTEREGRIGVEEEPVHVVVVDRDDQVRPQLVEPGLGRLIAII